MATYTGKDAVVEAGSTPSVVGKVKTVSYNGEVELQEDEYIGEPGKDVAVGNEKWTGSITYHESEGDAGQAELVLGASVAIKIYPQGKTTGKKEVSFTAIVTADPNTYEPGSKVEKVVPLAIQGVPTIGAVA